MPDETIEIIEEPGSEGTPEAAPQPPSSPDDEAARTDELRRLEAMLIAERERADRAEQSVVEQRERAEELARRLDEAEAALASVERRHRIDLLLMEQEALDLEAARLLTEAAAAQMPDADVAAVIADLRREKPFLFRRRGGISAAMSPASRGGEPADAAAEEAARTGDRRALLRYLRARRGAAD